MQQNYIEINEITKVSEKTSEYRKFYRIHHRGFMVHSKEYLPVKRRNSYTFKCRSGIYQIVYFVQCATESGYKYCAYVKPLEMIDSDSHIVKVKFSIGYKAISLDEIEDPVVFLKTDYDHNYISKFPNFFEKD